MKKEKAINLINPIFLNGIAHRGLHNADICENSLKAFKRAIDCALAFEFDVHVTKDLKVVVCHDSDLTRVTKKAGIIEELTLEEIQKNYSLYDGQTIPTLEEVLDLCNERVGIVVELKVYQNNFNVVAQKTMEILNKKIKDKHNVIIISFYGGALLKVKGYHRQLLVCEKNKWTFMFRHLFEGVDLEYTLLDNDKFKKYAKNHFTNIWTVRSMDIYNKYQPYCDTVTFEDVDYNFIVSKQKEK